MGKSWCMAFLIGAGLVGPAAAGDRVQNAWHDIVGVERFQGWKHQIPRRTVWSVEHEEIWSGWQSDSGQMQIQPLAGMVVGNWRRGIWAGGEVQWYSQNAEIWKNARASRRGGMVFGRMDVRRVFYDGSLEPGLDGAAQDITLRNTIAQVTAGVRWSAYQWDVEWARTWSQKSLTNR